MARPIASSRAHQYRCGSRTNHLPGAKVHRVVAQQTTGGDIMLRTHRLFSLFAAGLLALLCVSAQAQLADKKVLTLEGAKKAAAAAEAEAKKNNWNVVIAVVDDGGHLIYLQRMDGVQTGSIDVAIGKARTAMAFKRPTKVLEEVVLKNSRTTLLTLPGVTLLEGGMPITVGGQMVGAIGVSGVTSQQDAQIGQAGIDALNQ
jgi:uncharacterized protein GlcG (DUF336 family)